MATEVISREGGRNIRYVEDTKLTVESTFIKTDGTTSLGTVRTVIQTNAIGENPTVQINTEYRISTPTDDATCAELLEYADDMIGHWTAVKTKLQEVAASLIPTGA